VLGDLLDLNLRRGLGLTAGDPTPFFTRPVSAVLCAVVVITVLMTIPAVGTRVRAFLKGGFGSKQPRQAAGDADGHFTANGATHSTSKE
jgi:putative tricarboxylic transport membrane protein